MPSGDGETSIPSSTAPRVSPVVGTSTLPPHHGLFGSDPRVVECARVASHDYQISREYLAAIQSKSPDELFDMAEVSIFNACVDLSFAVDRHKQETGDRERRAAELKSQLVEKGNDILNMRAEVGRAGERSRVLEGKYEDVRKLLEKEKEEKSLLVSAHGVALKGLEAAHCREVLGKDAEIAQLRAELASSRKRFRVLEGDLTSSRKRIFVLEGELSSSHERVTELEDDLALATQSRRDLLAVFPPLFRDVLKHPDVMGILHRFSRAVMLYGKHLAGEDYVARHPEVPRDAFPSFYPKAYDTMVEVDKVFQAMDFPVLDRLVADLDTSIPDLLALLPPQS